MLTTSYQMTICVTWHRSSYNQPDRESRHISDRLFLSRSRGYFYRAPCIFAPGLFGERLALVQNPIQRWFGPSAQLMR